MFWIQEGTCHDPGHSWKDGYERGQKVLAYTRALPPPYAPGQFPRVGNTISTVSAEHFTFKRASLLTVIRLIPKMFYDLTVWYAYHYKGPDK